MKNIAILGAGKTGLSAYKHYTKLGYNVVLWDENTALVEKLSGECSSRSSSHGGDEISGGDISSAYNFVPAKSWDYKNLDFIITSPGISLEHPKKHYVLEQAEQNSVKIYCDIELFIQENPQIKYIAVSGTNGKSTVTALLRHIFEACGKKCTYAGNIGTPVFDLNPKLYDYIVLELSSYQLDLMNEIHFNCSLLLNIQEDHIDHHGTFANYVAVKYRIFENQTEDDIAIIDASLVGSLPPSKAQKVVVGVDITLSDTAIIYKGAEVINYSDLAYLKGEHNYKNISFAYMVAQFFKLSAVDIKKSILSFKGLKHRQNNLGEVNGVTFINDSKATNQESTLQALRAYPQAYLILGGVAKSDNLDVLLPYLKALKCIFLIGSSSDIFAKILAEHNIKFELSADLQTATNNAYKKALEDKRLEHNKNQPAVVLLSPACASFDQFKSFEERGDVFVNLVKNLQ